VRFGFVSDVHGDLEALRRALERLGDVDQIVCLGDVSGGQDSEACLQLMRELDIPGVPGNHDLWEYELVGLSASSLEYLKKRPLELRLADFLAVHSDYAEPERHFSYIHSETEARRAWERFADRLTFFGHTHLAQIHWLTPAGEVGFAKARSGRKRSEDRELFEFPLLPDHRYLINVGAVGEGFVRYDSAAAIVEYEFTRPTPAERPSVRRPGTDRSTGREAQRSWLRWLSWLSRARS
jgi:predicted phosphodiesterase